MRSSIFSHSFYQVLKHLHFLIVAVYVLSFQLNFCLR
nr:MAG TPA: hypothetical protein [Caudoviricetes sp.]